MVIRVVSCVVLLAFIKCFICVVTINNGSQLNILVEQFENIFLLNVSVSIVCDMGQKQSKKYLVHMYEVRSVSKSKGRVVKSNRRVVISKGQIVIYQKVKS